MKLITSLACSLLLLVSAGCVTAPLPTQAWQDESLARVWPNPPASPRIRLLRTISDEKSLGPEGRGEKLLSWVTGGTESGAGIFSPYAVTADGEGRIWLTDGGLSGVHLYDLRRREVSFLNAAGKARFVFPLGVVYDRALKRLYVADAQAAKVYALDDDGEPIESWSFPVPLKRPVGLAVGPSGLLYVCDSGRNVVEVVSSSGQYIRTLDSRTSRYGAMHRPTNVAVNSRGEVYVVDSFHFRILVFDANGEAVQGIGRLGDGPGYFARPRGIAIDSEDHIYVSDAAFDNIQIFDMAGNTLLYFGTAGSTPGYFSLPAGLFVDSSDRLYAVDTQNRRIQLFQYLAEQQ